MEWKTFNKYSTQQGMKDEEYKRKNEKKNVSNNFNTFVYLNISGSP